MPGKQVVLATYPTVILAEMVKERLSAEGIDSFIADEAVGSTYPGLEHALGGIRLFVDDADLERSTAILVKLSSPLGTATADEMSDEDLAALAVGTPPLADE